MSFHVFSLLVLNVYQDWRGTNDQILYRGSLPQYLFGPRFLVYRHHCEVLSLHMAKIPQNLRSCAVQQTARLVCQECLQYPVL